MQVQINFDTEHDSPVFVKNILSTLAGYEPGMQEPAKMPLAKGKKLKDEKISPAENTPSPAPSANDIPIEDVRAAMNPKIIAGKQKEVKAILDSFNAAGATSVEPKDRAAFIEQINAII